MAKKCVSALIDKGVKMPQAVSQCYPKATKAAKKAIAASLTGAAYGKVSAALEAGGSKNSPNKRKRNIKPSGY